MERCSWDILISVKVRVTLCACGEYSKLWKGAIARTKLIGNDTEVGQGPKLADGRDDDFTKRILGRKSRID